MKPRAVEDILDTISILEISKQNMKEDYFHIEHLIINKCMLKFFL